MIELPDFVGRQADEVKEKYGDFLDIKVIEEESEDAKSGEIIKQDTVEGTFTPRGETVTLTVAK